MITAILIVILFFIFPELFVAVGKFLFYAIATLLVAALVFMV